MPDHALEFMAEMKGVGSWAGPETRLEIGSVVSPPPACTGKHPSHSPQGRLRGSLMWILMAAGAF